MHTGDSVILLIYIDVAYMFLNPCYHKLCVGFFSERWWTVVDKENPHSCTVSELEEAIQGYFTADALPSSLSNTPGPSNKVRW